MFGPLNSSQDRHTPPQVFRHRFCLWDRVLRPVSVFSVCETGFYREPGVWNTTSVHHKNVRKKWPKCGEIVQKVWIWLWDSTEQWNWLFGGKHFGEFFWKSWRKKKCLDLRLLLGVWWKELLIEGDLALQNSGRRAHDHRNLANTQKKKFLHLVAKWRHEFEPSLPNKEEPILLPFATHLCWKPKKTPKMGGNVSFLTFRICSGNFKTKMMKKMISNFINLQTSWGFFLCVFFGKNLFGIEKSKNRVQNNYVDYLGGRHRWPFFENPSPLPCLWRMEWWQNEVVGNTP